MGARRRRAAPPRPSTRPSRSARCSTSATFFNAVRADRDRARARRRCWTPARRSSRRSGARRRARRLRAPRAAADRRRLLLLGRARVLVRAAALPHREVTSRRFVLVPLLELAPRSRSPRRRPAPRRAGALEARTSGAPARRWTWGRDDAARRRRRQHADPPRHLRRRRADRALALRHRARVDGRRARRRAAQPARAARADVRRHRRLDRLLHRAAAAAGVDGDGAALPRARDAAGRAGAEDRHADPLRQPARDRPRPARQRRRRLRPRRRRRA